MIHSFDTRIAEKVGINSAILLNNLYFWIEKNKADEKNYHDGYYWVYSSAKALEQLFPYLSQRQIETALKKLRDAGYIIAGNYNTSKYDRTLWYAITKEGESILQNCEIKNTSVSNGNDQNVEPIPDIKTDINKKESKKEKVAQKSLESIKKNDDDNKRVLAFEKSAPKKQKSFNELINAYTGNEDLRFELKEHLKTRKAKRATLSNRAIELSLKKLDEIGDNDTQKIKIVQNAIMNGWTSFYPLKDDYGYKTKPKTDPGDGKVTWADFPNASDADRICMTPETYKKRMDSLKNMEWDRTGGVF